MSNNIKEGIISALALSLIGLLFYAAYYHHKHSGYVTETSLVRVCEKNYKPPYTTFHTRYVQIGKTMTAHLYTIDHPERFEVVVCSCGLSYTANNKLLFNQVYAGQEINMAVSFSTWKGEKARIFDVSLIEETEAERRW